MGYRDRIASWKEKRRITIPPLRDRREDIPLIVRHYLVKRAANDPKTARFLKPGPAGALYPKMSGRLMEYLVGHDLPANVRDLERLLDAAVDFSKGDRIELPEGWSVARPAVTGSPPPASAKPAVPAKVDATRNAKASKVTKEVFADAVRRARGDMAVVARELDKSRSAVYALAKEYGIKPRDEGD